MGETMKAAVLTEAGFEIRELEKPTLGDDEVLIRTTASGVCTGDVFVYKNRAELAATHSLLGHEGSGVVAEIGCNVAGFAQGDGVTALGMPAYAEYFVTPPEKVVKLPPGIDPVLALGEPVACCVHASNRFGTQPGDRVAVAGCGFMGLMCLQLVRYQRAGFVCAIDPLDDRREMSRQFGADVAVDPVEHEAADIVAQYGEFDVVIEAAGTQSALDLGTVLVRQHGRLILIGYHQSNAGLRTVNMQQWNYKGIDVINAHVRRQDEKAAAMRQGMELLQQGHLTTAPLVTTYALADVDQAFRDLVAGREGLFKAVLLMGTVREQQ